MEPRRTGQWTRPRQLPSTLAPITSLAPEILNMVFKELQATKTNGRYELKDSIRTKRDMAVVCTFFRSVVHSTPELWTDVAVHRGGVEWGDVNPTTLAAVRMHLKNSRTLPLQVCFSDIEIPRCDRASESVEMLQLLMNDIHRIADLRVRIPHPCDTHAGTVSCVLDVINRFIPPAKLQQGLSLERLHFRISNPTQCALSHHPYELTPLPNL
ncbi:hypothetical protein B0H11DRAFT_1989916, partial [Mycena galericulata]